MTHSLLLVVQGNEDILSASLSALNASEKIVKAHGCTEIITLSLGKGSKERAEKITNYGIKSSYYLSNEIVDSEDPSVISKVIVQAVEQLECSIVCLASTSFGKDISPRISALLSAGQASDITGVNEDGTLTRPMYAGDLFAKVRINTDKKVITVRASAFDAVQKSETDSESKSQEISVDFAEIEKSCELISRDFPEQERPDLGDARIVVSGGRALKSEEGFKDYIFPLADSLGAAVGASRAAVDAGFAPNDWQVGQTGKIVSPDLYIAIGISGAIQHLAGMKDSKVIVAINKDKEAPIFEIADYGLVADLYEAVPELLEKLR